jgi:hypothetical protein
MKHLKPRQEDPLKGYTPIGKKDCQSMCDREVVMTKEGPVIICHGCKRVVMDNRKKKN